MKIRRDWFNIILLLIMFAIAGCETTQPEKSADKPADKKKETAEEKAARKKEEEKKKKELATIRFHLETYLDGTEKTRAVPVYRANPIYVPVEELFFLTEGDVDKAQLVDWAGTYAIEITFSHHGALLLESMTTANKGKHLAIYSDFGESKKQVQSRWLAAPLITAANASGVIRFVPDATREEAEIIVNGLNNVAKEVKKNSK